MKILLIGANSYVGARLYFDLKKLFRIVGTYSTHQLSKDFAQLDITRQKSVVEIISKQNPDIIIHSANNASTNWCEANPDKAVELNQSATKYIVDAANTMNNKIIYISTLGAIKQTNLYGKTKAESEKIIKQAKSGYLILRPSLILGYSPNTNNDRPFNRLLRNLDKDKPAIYDTSWKFQPTYIKHISDIIQSCIEENLWNLTISISVPELKSRFETARDILSAFGINVKPVNNHDDTFATFRDELVELHKFNLPQYSYINMVKRIVDEIKNRNKYTI
jgi:dTDP-4-dehydrorhamnose reductase